MTFPFGKRIINGRDEILGTDTEHADIGFLEEALDGSEHAGLAPIWHSGLFRSPRENRRAVDHRSTPAGRAFARRPPPRPVGMA